MDKPLRCLPWSIPGDHRGPRVKGYSSFARMSVSKQDYPCVAHALAVGNLKISVGGVTNLPVPSSPTACHNYRVVHGKGLSLTGAGIATNPDRVCLQSCLKQGTHAMNQMSLSPGHVRSADRLSIYNQQFPTECIVARGRRNEVLAVGSFVRRNFCLPHISGGGGRESGVAALRSASAAKPPLQQIT